MPFLTALLNSNAIRSRPVNFSVKLHAYFIFKCLKVQILSDWPHTTLIAIKNSSLRTDNQIVCARFFYPPNIVGVLHLTCFIHFKFDIFFAKFKQSKTIWIIAKFRENFARNFVSQIQIGFERWSANPPERSKSERKDIPVVQEVIHKWIQKGRRSYYPIISCI